MLLAEAFQGAADLLASTFLLIGLKRARHRPDQRHRFGYGRELYYWAFISSVMMLSVTATLSFYFGLERFLHPAPIDNVYLAIAILMVGLATNSYAFYLSYTRLSRKKTSITKAFLYTDLIETKTTFVLDQMGMLAAVFGLISLIAFVVTGNSQYDGLGAMVIGVAMAIYSLFIVIEVKDLLIGRGASVETETLIRSVALTIPGVKNVVELKTMHIGSGRLLVTLDVVVSAKSSTRSIQEVIDELKKEIKRSVPSAYYIQIEFETAVTKL